MSGASRSPRVSLPHVGALDGLRGVAVAGVLLYHGGRLTGGYLGVDLFFVLSGYLITSLLLTEWRGSDHVALGAFWARRARRLLPALVLVLAAVAIYCVVLADPAELARIRGDALATIGYVANWRAIFAHQSYFEIFLTPSPLQHTWSLAIEEQFYLVWPLVFVGLAAWWRDRTARAVLATALILGSGSALLMVGLYDRAHTNRVYYGTDTRAFALFAGIAIAAAVAIWGHARHRVPRAVLELAGAASVVTLWTMWAGLDGQDPHLYRGGFALAGIAAALLIAAAANPRRGPIGWVLCFPPLRWLGLISYGLYLWHWPVDVVATNGRTGLSGLPLFLLQTAIAVAIAVASYQLIEMPIRRGALRPRQWRYAIPAVTVVLLAAIITATSASASPPAARSASGDSVPGDPLDVLASLSDRQMRRAERRLDRLVEPQAPRVLLTGDSMAFNLHVGANRKRSAPLAVSSAAMRGCGLGSGTPVGPVYITPVAVCEQWPDVWERAVDIFHPRAIVLFGGVYDLWPHRVGDRDLGLYSKARRRDLLDQLGRGRRIANRAGLPFIILTVPCFRAGTLVQGRSPGAVESRQTQWVNHVYADFADRHPDVSLVDLGHHLCGVHPSPFADGVHLSVSGAAASWKWLTPRILRIIRDSGSSSAAS